MPLTTIEPLGMDKLNWPDPWLPPINLWNVPRQEYGMKVYIVYRVIKHEGWTLMKVFQNPVDAQHYKQYRDSLAEPEDTTYVVQEEEVL